MRGDGSEKPLRNDLDRKIEEDLDRELNELIDDKDKNKSDEVSEANTCIC